MTGQDAADRPSRCTIREHMCVTDDGLGAWCADATYSDLAAIPRLWAQMHEASDIPVCEQPHYRVVVHEEGPKAGQPVLDEHGQKTYVPVPCPDHVPASGPLMPGQAGSDKVSGSREAPIGVRVAILSFIGPAMDSNRALSPAWWEGDAEGDQVGTRPLLDTLCSWGRLMVDEHPDRLAGPKSRRIGTLVEWLLARHEWAMRQPWCDEYAVEIRSAVDHARRLLVLYDEQSELMSGLPCPRCDFFTLERHPGKSDVECARQSCRTVLRPEELLDWRKLYSANPKTAATQWEQADRLRVTADELSEDKALRRQANELQSIANDVEALTPEQWQAHLERLQQLTADVEARLRGQKGLPLRLVTGHQPLPIANSEDDVAPPELLDFLAQRLAKEGDPTALNMSALRMRGWLARYLAVQYETHEHYREEWRPPPLPDGWKETG